MSLPGWATHFARNLPGKGGEGGEGGVAGWRVAGSPPLPPSGGHRRRKYASHPERGRVRTLYHLRQAQPKKYAEYPKRGPIPAGFTTFTAFPDRPTQNIPGPLG